MDAFRHLNNCLYFRYFETSRMGYMSLMAKDMAARDPAFNAERFLSGQGVGMILASTQARFKAPIEYPDHIYVGCSCPPKNVGADRFTMEHAVFSTRLGRVAAEGTAEGVVYDYAARSKVPVPDALKQTLASLESLGPRRTDAEIETLLRQADAPIAY